MRIGNIPAVGIAISTVSDGNVVEMAELVSQQIDKLKAEQKKQDSDFINQSVKNAVGIKKAASGIGIKVDTDGISKDFAKTTKLIGSKTSIMAFLEG
jgi:multidrug efflux pump subunit AcrB